MSSSPNKPGRGSAAWERLRGMFHTSPTRSRLLTILPLLITVQTLGVGYAVMLRYEMAIDAGSLEDPIAQARVQRTNGLLLLGLGAESLVVGLVIAYAVRSSLRTVTEEVEQAAKGQFNLPTREVSEREVNELQGQIRHMLGTLNQMVRDSGMGATITVDLEGRVRMLNPLVQLLLRLGPEDAVGKHFREVFTDSNPRRNAELAEMLERSLEDQQPLPPRSVTLTTDRGEELSATVRTSFFLTEGVQHMAIVFSDYDPAQVEDIREKIERASRFLTLGSLAAHLAHEIRNPLTSIAGLVELLKGQTPREDVKDQYIHHIQVSANRLNELIEGLMDFSAIEKCELATEHLPHLVEREVSAKQSDPDWEDKTLRLEGAADLPPVRCNHGWLGRALNNLLDNAREATPSGGTVTVYLRTSETEEAERFRRWVDLTVHNTGSYIPPENREKILEPFETGRPAGHGLGLSIVQEIVRAHGGQLLVESDEREGTSFTVRLPEAESERNVSRDAD